MQVQERQEEIRSVLKTVDDPELPSVSVMDLGMVYDIAINDGSVSVSMVPTFAGCPALDFIEIKVQKAIEEVPWVTDCDVEFSFQHKWSTDAITDTGKAQLKKHGIAPPPEDYRPGEEWTVNCPYCGSDYTSMDNVFGPTACRSILYCSACKNPFEAMKPVVEDTAN
ncbi:1,2-phenylacetyl-CoA epoxidase subunit PaaD [Tenuibacillus multivorans]|uniref:Ring-1,2-phenylacetyl-CoA epoxidase subunit PaaD n=1 Tax=Tenuibacillus multivorans TaxID=237069 RepID=A0A1H0BV79_9BACI|nr:1,2-phenylacetyl-CoA epoxidase subunit PaaD [Tenuibacillus multivorans]GEL77023.1 phenylacetate-CoA oxygenase subunit PaaJ [Tenuibacillus multivorans]SDN49493.1 ring-1,2-phenylacetyl-CoA epoxidase subunit PaaD [Tenuibacillus multivorans]